MCVHMFKSSHRPMGKLLTHGKTTDSLASARCLQGGGGVLVYGGSVTIASCTISGNTLLENAGYVRARALTLLKVPIAPMGKLLTCLPRLTLAQLRTLRSTIVCTCHRDLENFPLPPWETHVLLVVCRAAVSTSLLARSR